MSSARAKLSIDRPGIHVELDADELAGKDLEEFHGDLLDTHEAILSAFAQMEVGR